MVLYGTIRCCKVRNCRVKSLHSVYYRYIIIIHIVLGHCFPFRQLKKGGVDTDTLSVTGESAFIFWQWLWMDDDELESEDSSECERDVIHETPPEVSEDESEIEEEKGATCNTPIVHTVLGAKRCKISTDARRAMLCWNKIRGH